MFRNSNREPETLVAGVFCEPFSAADAVRALNDSGFEDHDIDLIGILSGRAPDLSWFLVGMGVPPAETEYYNTCMENGGVLVLVRTLASYRRSLARRVLRRHGGTFPAES